MVKDEKLIDELNLLCENILCPMDLLDTIDEHVRQNNEWNNYFIDYIKEQHQNLYNEACEYADKKEETE